MANDFVGEAAKIFFYGFSWWVIPLLLLFFYRKKQSKYPIEVVVFEKRGENLVYNHDCAGRFADPINCYRLKKSKDTIPIPQYDWVLQYMAQPRNFIEKLNNFMAGKIGTIVLFKYGSKQYKPIDVRIGSKTIRKFKEVKDKHGNSVWITVYEPINVKREMSRLDFEVIDWDDINHMIQEIRATISRRSPAAKFMEKYGALVGLGLVAAVFIIAIYYAHKLLIDAGDRYISAAKDVSGFGGQTSQGQGTVDTVANTTDLPLAGLLPKN